MSIVDTSRSGADCRLIQMRLVILTRASQSGLSVPIFNNKKVPGCIWQYPSSLAGSRLGGAVKRISDFLKMSLPFYQGGPVPHRWVALYLGYSKLRNTLDVRLRHTVDPCNPATDRVLCTGDGVCRFHCNLPGSQWSCRQPLSLQ